MFIGIIITKLMAVYFSLDDYGTYSQAMLIVSTVTSISILGLTDAVNYFYNIKNNSQKKEEYISTIFSIQYFIGGLCGLLVLLFAMPIIQYFDNNSLRNVLYFAAFLPVLENLFSMLQVLFISIGEAKMIAVRNFFVSLVRLGGILVACFITKNIITIFFVLFFMDLIQVIYFMYSLSNKGFNLSIKNMNMKLVPEILKFSIPMVVFILTNSLSRDIDKYVVSYFSNTETLAIYTNAAKVLPFDVLTSSFITVLIPIITRKISTGDYEQCKITFSYYLRIGYLITWIFVAGSIANAKELMLILYDEKYLPGLGVFVVYLFVDLIRFANTSLILSGSGKTNLLMILSILSLIMNFILNIIMYNYIGLLGPAFATFITTFFLVICFIYFGSKIINCKIKELFNFKEMVTMIGEIIIIFIITQLIKSILYLYIDSYLIVFLISYSFFCLSMIFINKSKIIDSLKIINRLK
ncbi:oligosaccharide flippase family protein [Faecalitalea cylindroides]|nr:oligosaccharide flippase family protein [Faecalitalea cylindroides]